MSTTTILPQPGEVQNESSSPSVVITLPFDPKMTPKGQLEAALKGALSQAEHLLLEEYPGDTALPVISRLQQVVRELNFATHKKSLAIFVTGDTARVLYLDIPVDTRVLIDSDFRMRDLATPRDTEPPYLLLVLSSRYSKMFHFDGRRLQLVKTNAAAPKEEELDQFLRQMDCGLSAILNAWPLPVFVLGTERVTGHFSAITRNDRHIAVYIHKNCIGSGEEELLETVRPYLKDWEIYHREMAMKHIEAALETGKLTCGVEAISRAVRARNNKLLIVERDFSAPAVGLPSASGEKFYLHDLVDAMIEQVLENGGQVKWVDEGQLEDYGHIALVRYY